jgi:hypothetical protein
MKPGSTCTPDHNCALGDPNDASQGDPFVIKTLLDRCKNGASWKNLALSTSGASAAQSSDNAAPAGLAPLAIDGITDGNWYHGSVSHTQNYTTSTFGSSSTGTWMNAGRTFQNSPGTMAVNGGTMYGIEPFGSGTAGTVDFEKANNINWTVTNNAMTEISIGPNNVVWGINASGVFKTSPGTNWQQMSSTVYKHVAAGDGVHPWFITSNQLGLDQYDGSTFVRMNTQASLTYQRISVGADGDPWFIRQGTVVHYVGGVGFVAAPAPNFGGPVTPNFISVGDARNVWVVGNVFGIFNYFPETNSWQRHCPPAPNACTLASNGSFKAVSASTTDGVVYALTTGGDVYVVDKSKAVNHNDPTSTDSSLVNIPVPVAMGQIAAGGGSANGFASAWAISTTGATYRLGNYDNSLATSGGEWLRIDLGAVKHVSQIRIFNRTECCSYRLTPSRIEFFNGQNWNVAVDHSTISTNGVDLLIDNLNINTRYIQIRKTGIGTDNDYLHVGELQVWGPAATVVQP